MFFTWYRNRIAKQVEDSEYYGTSSTISPVSGNHHSG